jgi:hypothetical protein
MRVKAKNEGVEGIPVVPTGVRRRLSAGFSDQGGLFRCAEPGFRAADPVAEEHLRLEVMVSGLSHCAMMDRTGSRLAGPGAPPSFGPKSPYWFGMLGHASADRR